MRISARWPKRTCPETGVPVRTNQTETECRTQNDCTQRVCPLGGSFESEPIDFVLEAARKLDR